MRSPNNHNTLTEAQLKLNKTTPSAHDKALIPAGNRRPHSFPRGRRDDRRATGPAGRNARMLAGARPRSPSGRRSSRRSDLGRFRSTRSDLGRGRFSTPAEGGAPLSSRRSTLRSSDPPHRHLAPTSIFAPALCESASSSLDSVSIATVNARTQEATEEKCSDLEGLASLRIRPGLLGLRQHHIRRADRSRSPPGAPPPPPPTPLSDSPPPPRGARRARAGGRPRRAEIRHLTRGRSAADSTARWIVESTARRHPCTRAGWIRLGQVAGGNRRGGRGTDGSLAGAGRPGPRGIALGARVQWRAGGVGGASFPGAETQGRQSP